MTHLRLHLVYLAVIGFLAYQYWTKTQALNNATQSIEQLDKLLKMNNIVADFASKKLYKELELEAKAYASPITVSNFYKAQNVDFRESSIHNWLDIQKMIFDSLSKKDMTDVNSNLFNKNASNTFFSKRKIQEIQDSLYHFQQALNNISDSTTLKHLKEQYTSLKLLQEDDYWQKLSKKTNEDAFLQLSAMQNKMLLDKVSFFNYLISSYCRLDMKFDEFKVAIAPQKTVLIEGETFKADIYLAAYSSRPGSDVTIWVNNQDVPVKEGVAHFENTEQFSGKKNVKAMARVKNPLTGQITNYIGEFEYEVLSKCHRDCK